MGEGTLEVDKFRPLIEIVRNGTVSGVEDAVEIKDIIPLGIYSDAFSAQLYHHICMNYSSNQDSGSKFNTLIQLPCHLLPVNTKPG